MRDESTDKNNPLLTRIEIIQKEIDEIRNREREYRKIHANEFGDLVDIDDDNGHDDDDAEEQQDSLENNNNNGHDEKSSSDGGLSSTPSTSNSISDLSYQKPLDVTHRQPSLNAINMINSNGVGIGASGNRHLLRSPVSPVSGVAFQPRVFVPNQKGLMQKFIISHGKIGNNHQQHSERNGFQTSNGIHHADYVTSAIELSEPGPRAPIERDGMGRPLRKGYVPVKDKIQQELQDLESREAELKVLRKNLVQEMTRQDSDNQRNGHNKHSNNSAVVQADVKSNNCDKTTLLKELNEVPSSTKLIEQWENLIKEKEQQRQKTL